MAAVLTRVLAPARNRFLRQSTTNTNVSNVNTRGFEHNAQPQDVTMADVEEDETGDVAQEEDIEEDDEEDADAEGEPDEEVTPPIEVPDLAEDDDEYEEQETTQKARRRSGRPKRQKRSESLEDDVDMEEDEDGGSDDDEDDEEELQLDDESEANDEEVAEVEAHDPNLCVFCGQSEEHDPSEDFEEYLACAVCGDNGRLMRCMLYCDVC